jgi:phospholipid/cholesterol/gamma-HCH transport system substrate-binding protein
MKRRYLIAIGLMVVIALGLITRALIFLHPTPGDGAQMIRVRFQNVDKISPGTRVTFAGKPVGEVKRIDLLPDAFHRTEATKKIFPYELLLAIDSSVIVYKSDEISVKTAGLMGERFIAITPRSSLMQNELHPVDDDVIYASQSGNVEEAFSEISSVAQKADKTMEALIQLIQRNEEGIYQATRAVQDASNQLAILLKTLNTNQFGEHSTQLVDQLNSLMKKIDEEQLVASLATTINHLKSVSEHLDQPQTITCCLDNANKGLASFANAADSFHETSQAFKKVAEEVSSMTKELLPVVTTTGNGTSSLGKLMKDSRLYDTLLATSNVTHQLIKDIDTYGMLFHLNKDWQREKFLRDQKSEILLSEHAKQEFSNIAASIDALNLKLLNARETLSQGSIADNQELRIQFSSGLKQVQDEIDRLQEALKQLDETPDDQPPAK